MEPSKAVSPLNQVHIYKPARQATLHCSCRYILRTYVMRIGTSIYSLMWPDALSSNETRTRRREDDERRRNEGLPVPKRVAFVKRDMAKSTRFRHMLPATRSTGGGLDSSPPHTSDVNRKSKENPILPPNKSPTEEQPPSVANRIEPISEKPAVPEESQHPLPANRSVEALQKSTTTLDQSAAVFNELNTKQFSHWPRELTHGLEPDSLRHNLSLLEPHLPSLQTKDSVWLEKFQLLVLKDAEWTASNFSALQALDSQYLHHLLALLNHNGEWTKSHFDTVRSMDMKGLLVHLENDHEWTTKNLAKLHNIQDIGGLVPWVRKEQQWATRNLRALALLEETKLNCLTELLENHRTWTIRNFQKLRRMNNVVLGVLPHILDNHDKWATDHLNEIGKMEGNIVEKLVSLLTWHTEWSISHFNDIENLGVEGLETLLLLLNKNPGWTTENFPLIKESFRNAKLPKLIKENTDWAIGNLVMFQRMSHMTSLMFWEYYENNKEDSQTLNIFDPEELLKLQEASADKELAARNFFLHLMDECSSGFNRAANPFLREFQGSGEATAREEDILASNGASRSTLALHGNTTFFADSFLIDKFRMNHRLLPDATFGVENEMYLPAIPDNSDEFNTKMNSLLRTQGYSYVTEQSLLPMYLTQPIEQVSPILQTPKDIQELQNVTSIINDWGGSTNQSAGTHIHTGFKQWRTIHSLKNPSQASRDLDLSAWDASSGDDSDITPFQLLLMKQFLINMASIQEDFYEVSRPSEFNRRNAPVVPDELGAFFERVSAASDLTSLIQVTQGNSRDYCVNLHAFFALALLRYVDLRKRTVTTWELTRIFR